MSYIATVSPTVSPTSVACDVDRTYYPHLFLIPAGIIITILAFLQRRRSFKKDVWGGRPGIVVPIDFLRIDHDRLAIMFVFGAATGSIVLLVTKYGTQGRNAWESAFLTIGIAIEHAFIYYPYFACLASYHRIIGALMGLPYTAIFFCVSMTADYQQCNGNTTWQIYVGAIYSEIPIILCQVFILGKFILVLYREIKDYGIFGGKLFSRDDENASPQVKLVRPWLRDYVKDLINSRTSRQYSRIEFYLRKIYNPDKNFKFSTQTLSVVMICCILLYDVSITFVFFFSYYLDLVRKAPDSGRSEIVAALRALFGSLIIAAILAAIVCVLSLIRFMENHKNNMLRMFKGDKSFIPDNISVSQFMIGKGLRYPSFQIGYFLWGYVLVWILFSVICFLLYSLSFSIVRDLVMGFIDGGGVFLGVALLLRLFLLIASVTIFRDRNYSRDVISINNRNVYLVFSYFWFFVGLPMGFISAILRILKTMAVGALMLPRIDHSIMPDGFQRIDSGFNAYICYLHVQTAHRNPILRVFCQILSDDHETQNKNGPKWTRSAQARAKWFLALTLARNPQLASERKRVKTVAPMQAVYVKHGDVRIEVGQYGPTDNAALIRDNTCMPYKTEPFQKFHM